MFSKTWESTGSSQSEIYHEIFNNDEGVSGKISYNFRGRYVCEVQIFNV